MRKLLVTWIMVGVFAPTIVFSQKNRISVFTGLFHEYFDGTPTMNINYRAEGDNSLSSILYSSFGFQYARNLNKHSQITIGAQFLNAFWRYTTAELLTNVISDRYYGTYNITYERIVSLSSNFNFTYGGGINFRHGNDLIIEYYYHINNFKEIVGSTRILNDYGLNIRTGIEYSPLKWLTLYTKFNLLGFIIFDNMKTIRDIQMAAPDFNYPTRFDLSLRFGIGFNFGKK